MELQKVADNPLNHLLLQPIVKSISNLQKEPRLFFTILYITCLNVPTIVWTIYFDCFNVIQTKDY